MSTMNQIVDAALAEVYGYTSTVDTTTYLVGSIDADDLSFVVGDASQFSRGIVQIDNELLLISSVNKSTNTLAISSAVGRGIRGTTAATHDNGAIVTMSPSIPRVQAINAVNQTVKSSNGLFAIGSTSFTFNAAVTGYSIPDDVETILSVAWLPTGPSNEYQRVRRWTHDKFNGQIVLGDAIQPGRIIEITYSKAPTVPALTAEFSTSGLPESCEDVIRFGAAWRITSFLEPMSILGQSAEADAMDRQLTPGSRIRVAQYLYQIYRQRLEEEVSNLQSLFPIRTHFGG